MQIVKRYIKTSSSKFYLIFFTLKIYVFSPVKLAKVYKAYISISVKIQGN